MHVGSILVENHAGVLSRISGLFSRRMYNIDSLSVGVIVDISSKHMTAELTGAPSKISAFIALMEEQYKVQDLVRTGLTGLARG